MFLIFCFFFILLLPPSSPLTPPLFPYPTLFRSDALVMLKQSPGGIIFVVDEFGSLEGIVTPGDILESIAGSFALPDGSGEHGAVRRADGSWLLDRKSKRLNSSH